MRCLSNSADKLLLGLRSYFSPKSSSKPTSYISRVRGISDGHFCPSLSSNLQEVYPQTLCSPIRFHQPLPSDLASWPPLRRAATLRYAFDPITKRWLPLVHPKEVDVASATPELGQMKQFASHEEVLAGFDWRKRMMMAMKTSDHSILDRLSLRLDQSELLKMMKMSAHFN